MYVLISYTMKLEDFDRGTKLIESINFLTNNVTTYHILSSVKYWAYYLIEIGVKLISEIVFPYPLTIAD